MTKEHRGDKFRLLVYERRISRHRWSAFLLTILLLGLWYPVSINYIPWPPRATADWLLTGGIVALVYWLFTVVAPLMAYAQAREDYLRLQTPIYRLNISYQRIHNTRPIQISKMFPPFSLNQRELWLLEPFFSLTALGVDVRGWPVRPDVLRLFFNPLFLANDQPGFVILVRDWMTLSNQIHAYMDAQRAERIERPRTPGISAADILREE